ncbi:MAG: UDP-N-acetylglucosamine 2-epimerase (hydrolyzing) [Leptospiraceae bacterium]|nr:UDP-N-acetylglucosamine 2-epimerase (hydrolyzing) [Leptospiraceae bacterium]
MTKKRVTFLTGTRADFGKLKSLISITQSKPEFDVHIFATGMHMSSRYGRTVDEIAKSGFENIYSFINHDDVDHMDRTLAKTVDGFSHYISELRPDLVVVHGDRVEALAGAIVGSLNNILVAHIEGGEVSGTIDELIRHAVTKLSHAHLVANEEARKRLLQLGEKSETIFVIGSPDLDLMKPEMLPDLEIVKQHYGIPFTDYAVLILHPVTTEVRTFHRDVSVLREALEESGFNYVVVYPNNDLGSMYILEQYELLPSDRFKVYPSLRFEYFLALLRNARFIIGNSSAGVREAPYYNVPTIDVGNRQNKRAKGPTIRNVPFEKDVLLNTIHAVLQSRPERLEDFRPFGDGTSDRKFLELLQQQDFWKISHQKEFQDIQ